MNEPKTSFLGGLTREGRLKNRWARGCKEKDPDKSLNHLRKVQDKLIDKPDKFAHLWLPFLDTFFDVSRIDALTDSDIEAVKEMGEIISQYDNIQIHAENVWLRIVYVYDTRKEEEKARALLTYIYNAPSTSSKDVKIECACNLAKRGARGKEHITIYIDHLNNTSDSKKETVILNLLSDLCKINFDSTSRSIKRAGDIARQLIKNDSQVSGRNRLKPTEEVEHQFINNTIQVSGLQKALGLYTLQIDKMPSIAVKHFEIAFQTEPDDRVAQIGLLCCLILNEDYSKFTEVIGDNVHSDDAVVTGLVNFNAVLQWINNPEMTGSPPCDAKSISQYNIEKYIGESYTSSIGIMYLLEGNAKQAFEILYPLVIEHPKQHQWNYYAAWAAALVGEKEAVARCYINLGEWKGRWTIVCILMDTDPTLAKKYSVDSHLSQSLSAIVAARLALLNGTPPDKINWEYDPGITLVENLEALRTLIGCAIYTKDIDAIKEMLNLPVFQRLPLVDQMLWRGLYLLYSDDFKQGRTLLEKAAKDFGYQRAALALSVHFLEQNMVEEAKQFLDMAAAGREDTNIELLYAYIEANEGKTQTSTERLEKLKKIDEVRTHYALGNLYLQNADETRKAGNPDNTRIFYEQAAGAFKAALKTKSQSLPTDCNVLAQCAELLARPDKITESHRKLWHEVNQLDLHRQRSWIVWNAFLVQLRWGSPSVIAKSSKNILALLKSIEINNVDDSTLDVVASAIANACIRAKNVNQANKLLVWLKYLSVDNNRQVVKPYYRQSISAIARMTYLDKEIKSSELACQKIVSLVEADPENGNLSLVLAQAYLKDNKLEEAADVLRNAQLEDDFENALCNCLADLIQGNTWSLEDLPQPALDVMPGVIQAYRLLRAAVAFTSDEYDQGYKAIVETMKNQSNDMASVFNFTPFLPAICANSTGDGSVPPILVEAIHKLSQTIADEKQGASVARSAASIGEEECACRLWEQALAKQPDNPTRQEYAGFLCHMAVRDYNSGDYSKVVRKLRLASELGGEQHS